MKPGTCARFSMKANTRFTAQTRALDGRDVDECVLAAIIRLDEAEAFGGVEEFHGAYGQCSDPLRGDSGGDMPPATFG